MNVSSYTEPLSGSLELDHREQRWFRKPLFLILVITLVGLLATYSMVEKSRVAARDSDFARQAQGLHERLSERIKTSDEILRGAVGLFAVHDRLDRDTWRRYVRELQIDETRVGMQGLGVSLLIDPRKLDEHIQSIRAEGYADYEVLPAGPRERISSVVFLEPFQGRNRRAFGFDMLSESVRAAAMQRAQDEDQIYYTGPVKLVQETEVDVQSGVIAYLPIYERGSHPISVEQRRGKIRGWVHATFRVGDLMQAVFKNDLQQVRVRVEDTEVGGSDGAMSRIFDSMGDEDLYEDSATVQLPLRVHGRHWKITYQPMPGVWPLGGQWTLWIAFGVVILFSASIGALIWSLSNTRKRAYAIAQELATTAQNNERTYQMMIENVKDYAMLLLDVKGNVLSWNEGAKRIKGYEKHEIIGQHFSKFYPEEDQKKHMPDMAIGTALVAGKFHEDGWRVRKDGTRFRASVLISSIYNTEGQVMCFAKVTRDITEQYEREESLRLSETVFENTQEGIVITDKDARMLKINPAFELITEYSEAELIHQNMRIIASGRHDRDFYTQMWRSLQVTGSWQGEIWNRRKTGQIHPAWLAISAVYDEHNNIINYVCIYTDITCIPHAEMEIQRLAHHDALTDLPNRLLLSSRLSHSIERAKRNNKSCAVLFMDLDRFKPINDTYGHEAGDQILKGVAQRLLSHLRENDTVARLGGDEFVVVLEDLTSSDGAGFVAKGIIERLQQPFQLNSGVVVSIGCSVGIAMFPENGVSTEELIRNADEALYAAKNDGRGNWKLSQKEAEPTSIDSGA